MQVMTEDLDRGLLRQKFNAVKSDDFLQLEGRDGELTFELAAVAMEPLGKVENGGMAPSLLSN